MKNILAFVGFLLVIILLWYTTKQSKNQEFKNNLPQTIAKNTTPTIDLKNDVFSKSSPTIPLIDTDNFELNEAYKTQIVALYSYLFDTLQVLRVAPEQIKNSRLCNLNASSLIQLHAFHTSVAANDPEKRETFLLLLGVWLKNPEELFFFKEKYLFENDRWLFQMKKLHIQLMREPQDALLNQAFIDLLDPADSEKTLDYLKLVQYLDRGPTDEYFHVNKEVLERFDDAILKAILNKVDDYSWWAAYPERDAEQGILEILKKRKS